MTEQTVTIKASVLSSICVVSYAVSFSNAMARIVAVRGRVLLDLFARPSTGPRLAGSGHAAEVICPELPRRGGTALVPHDGSRCHLGLADQVIGKH